MHYTKIQDGSSSNKNITKTQEKFKKKLCAAFVLEIGPVDPFERGTTASGIDTICCLLSTGVQADVSAISTV